MKLKQEDRSCVGGGGRGNEERRRKSVADVKFFVISTGY